MTPTPQDKTAALEAIRDKVRQVDYLLGDEISVALTDDLINIFRAVLLQPAWQGIDTAPFGASDKPETYFIGAKLERGKTLVATCYKNEHGVFEWFGGGMMALTHWRPLEPLPPPPTDIDSGEG